MKKHKVEILYGIWAVMYIGAVLLSLIDDVQGAGAVLLNIYSVLFFVPGGILAYWAISQQDKAQLRLLRIISGVSLSVTAVTLVIIFLFVQGSSLLGKILNSVLILFSAPFMIAPFWAASLFLWACLLMVTIPGFVYKKEE